MRPDVPTSDQDPGPEPIPVADGPGEGGGSADDVADGDAGESSDDDANGGWVLQSDAAIIAGCSLSAVRKWRREGLVNHRRTTTSGGLERVEVRLQDVIDRCSRRADSGPHLPPGVEDAPEAGAGTVYLPLADLQALILNLGEAERRALEATHRATSNDAEVRRLTDALARAEAGVGAARSEVDRQRRRVRELEAGWAGGPAPTTRTAKDEERIREHVARLEARIAEARTEVEGQRRRIRELESRLSKPSEATVAAELEAGRLRERLTKLERRLGAARKEFDGQQRRIRELEAHLAKPSERTLATEAENERLLERVAQLEARAATATEERDDRQRRVGELEASLAAMAEEVSSRPVYPPVSYEPAPYEPSPYEPAAVEPVAVAEAVDVAAAPPMEPSPAPAPEHGAPPGGEPTQAHPGPSVAHVDSTAAQLRRLYHRLQERRRSEATSPEENRQWTDDLAAYDEALVLACVKLGVPTDFPPGAQLSAEDRVRLTRDLGAAGLDVRQPAAG